MKDKIKNYTTSIRFKLIIIFIVLFLIPFLLVETIIYRTIEDRTLEDTNEQMINNLQLVSDYTSTFLGDIQIDFQNIIFQEDFILSLFNVRNLGSISTLDELEATEKLSDDFEPFLENDRIHSVYLYNMDNEVFYDFSYMSPGYLVSDMENSDWFKVYLSSTDDQVKRSRNLWLQTKSIPNLGRHESVNIVSNYMLFQSSNGLKTILSVNVDTQQLVNVIDSLILPERSMVYITDSRGKIVASNSSDSIGYNLLDYYDAIPANNDILSRQEESRHISYYESGINSYRFFIDVPYSHITSTASESRLLLFGLYFAIILILLTMNLVIQRFLLKPIQAMIEKMRHVEQGDFNVTLPDNRRDELGILYKNFNEMTRNIHSLIEKNYVEALLRKQSDLNYIQTQLNEHFLYNTLDAIHSLIMTNDRDAAQKMLISLSKFFRTTLNNGKQVISIKEIYQMLENYIAIINLRNSDRFVFRLHVDDSLLDTYALKFLFQPILENAIIHGAGRRRSCGEIKLEILRNGDKLAYTVWDNGPGIQKDKLDKLNGLVDQDNLSFESEYFALNNIVNQAKLFYKSDFNLLLESQVNRYTKCSIEIPILAEPVKGGVMKND